MAEQPIPELTKPKFTKIGDLSPASVGFNILAKQIGDIKTIINRKNLNGTKLRISEANIGDETGCIILSLRNDQIDMVQPGGVLILRNAKIDMVNQGFMRVAIDRWGIIQSVEAERMDAEVKSEHNLSKVEYELVRSYNNYNRGYGGRGRRGRGGYRGNNNYGGYRGRNNYSGGYGGRGRIRRRRGGNRYRGNNNYGNYGGGYSRNRFGNNNRSRFNNNGYRGGGYRGGYRGQRGRGGYRVGYRGGYRGRRY